MKTILKTPFRKYSIFIVTVFNLYSFIEAYTQEVPAGSLRQPVYFHISHHQEAVGRFSEGFPKWAIFKHNLKDELATLDKYDIVSDQCFSDFIVSVILYMKNSGKDESATDIFKWFNESRQNLGFHFHPSTWDINIRLDKIAEMDLYEGIKEYTKWEDAYYDWSGCNKLHDDSTKYCGTLDTAKLGGIGLMLEYFKKPVVNECLTMINPAAGQVIRKKFGQIKPIVGQAGNPHSYYSTPIPNFANLWMSDWMFSTEPGIYVYRMMGNYYIQNRSEAWIEGLMDTGMLKQVLAVLPRNIPHLFAIHMSEAPMGDSTLEHHLKYLTNEFIPGNKGSCFISTADIPNLVLPNSYEFTMSELESACTDLLANWHGRPPAFASYNGKYTSLASLFIGLQAAIKSWHESPMPHTWPVTVRVPEFIMPPLCRQNEVVTDKRLAEGFSFTSMFQAVKSLFIEDSIPFMINIPYQEQPLRANAAEFLNGMCSMFLRIRLGETDAQLYILPSSIIPISFLPIEVFLNDKNIKPTNMDWLSGLQLWTTEPLRLKGNDELSINEYSRNNEDNGIILKQNYPNPFENTTIISLKIQSSSYINLKVFDSMGKEVKTLFDGLLPPGEQMFNLDASSLPAGLYFYQLSANGKTITKKMQIFK